MLTLVSFEKTPNSVTVFYTVEGNAARFPYR